MPYWFAGQPYDRSEVTLAVNDPALLYGATVFTTLRVYQHNLDHPLTRWDDHIHRLRHALAAFQWPEPNWERVRQGSEVMQQSFPLVRMTCLPDGRELITGRSLPPDLENLQQQGIAAWLAAGRSTSDRTPAIKRVIISAVGWPCNSPNSRAHEKPSCWMPPDAG